MTAHRVSAVLTMVVATAVTITAMFISHDYFIPALMLWVAAGILWRTRLIPNRKEDT